MTVVDRQTADGITTVTLDRPEALNAFNNAVFDELCDAFLSAATMINAKSLCSRAQAAHSLPVQTSKPKASTARRDTVWQASWKQSSIFANRSLWPPTGWAWGLVVPFSDWRM